MLTINRHIFFLDFFLCNDKIKSTNKYNRKKLINTIKYSFIAIKCYRIDSYMDNTYNIPYELLKGIDSYLWLS